MASYMKHLFLLTLLFLAISLQVHARESQFFSKTTRSEDPSTNYNYNPNTNNYNNAAFMDQSNSIPSSFASEFTDRKERNVNGDVPSSFVNEFDENKERGVDDISSSSSFTTSEFDENKGRNFDDTPSSFASEFPSRSFNENQEYYYNVNSNIPKERSYGRNQQYGMSDTRFLENGRYFYDVNGERNHGQYDPMNGNNNDVGRFGSWHGANYRNNNEMQGYQNNNQENQKRQDEYYDP